MVIRDESIFIVDDEQALRKLLSYWLGGNGFQCHEAESGEKALAALEEKPADLVILDIRLPGKSGIQLIPEIVEAHPDTAIVMATAVSDTQTAVQCMKLGAYDFLTKPFDLKLVSRTVEKTLQERKAHVKEKEYRKQLEQMAKEQFWGQHDSMVSSLKSLAYALEAKDKYTSGHSERVSLTAVSIAEKLWLPSETIEKIRLAGIVHDIGKIGISETVLNKPGVLTPDEFQLIKRHCEIGEHILLPALKDEIILKSVKYHHENFDGSGYPDRLKADEIPLGARIIAVADSFDAMVSERPYRHAMSIETACQELIKYRAQRFDSEIVNAFLDSIPPCGKGESVFSDQARALRRSPVFNAGVVTR